MLSASLILDLHKLGLDAAHLYVLTRIHQEGKLTPKSMEGDEMLDRHILSRRLRDLRQKGMLQKLPLADESDGRSMPYDLTAMARELFDKHSTTPEPAHA